MGFIDMSPDECLLVRCSTRPQEFCRFGSEIGTL